MWWWSAVGGEAPNCPVIRSQCFREPVPLGCEPHNCFTVSHAHTHTCTLLTWDRMSRVGSGWIFPFSHMESRSGLELVISLPQAGWALKKPNSSGSGKIIFLRASFVKDRMLGIFQSGSYFPPPDRNTWEFFSHIHCELVWLLGAKLTKVSWPLPPWLVPLGDFKSHPCPCWASRQAQLRFSYLGTSSHRAFCSGKSWFPVLACLSLQFWGQWFALDLSLLWWLSWFFSLFGVSPVVRA